MQDFFKRWFKYVHIKNLDNNKMKKSFLNIIPHTLPCLMRVNYNFNI